MVLNIEDGLWKADFGTTTSEVFSKSDCCTLSVGPDVSQPHFQFDFPQICTATFSFDKELDPFLGLHDPILSGGFYPEAPTQKSSQQKSWSGLDALIYIALTFNLVICK